MEVAATVLEVVLVIVIAHGSFLRSVKIVISFPGNPEEDKDVTHNNEEPVHKEFAFLLLGYPCLILSWSLPVLLIGHVFQELL